MSQSGSPESMTEATGSPRLADASAHARSSASLSQGHEASGNRSRGLSAAPDERDESHRQSARSRRRTTQACDDCRRRKIKCDGRHPCSACAEFDSKCTYARIVRQRRARPRSSGTDSSSGTLGALKKKLCETESILQRILQRVDVGDPNAVTRPRQASRSQSALPPAPRMVTSPDAARFESSEETTRFITLIDSVNQVESTNSGEYDFHGLSSDAAFLRRITQHLPGLLRYDSRPPFLPQPDRPSLSMSQQLPLDSAGTSWQAEHDFSRLPQRQLALVLCDYAFSRASCILRVIHAPSFWKVFDKLYHERPQKFTVQERRFVGLLFSVMALGSMYDVDENDPSNPDHYIVATQRGYDFYVLAKHYLPDVTECCDITTLQALVFVIQFLQATGNLNGCHTYIGIALRSALRMGLHRHLSHMSKTPIIDETRRRLFYTIRQMDIYLSATLGLPLPLQDNDIDQAWPTEVDDEYITESSIQMPPHERPSLLEAFNAHANLMRILAKVVDYLYPPIGPDKGAANVTYTISVAKIRELEEDLHAWHERLSPTWLPGPEKDLQIARIKILLRFAYAHVQMMLYRPFLQYYSQQSSAVGTANECCFVLATAGINVCRNIVHIGIEIRKQAVMIGPYWYITYTQFFAVLSLLLYVFNNPNQPGVLDVFSDAKLGKDCISSLTQRSLVADRVTTALNALFDHLPESLRPKERPSRVAYPASMSDPRHSHLGFQMPDSLQERTPRPEQWSTNTVPASANALFENRTANYTDDITNSSPLYTSRSAPYHVPSNVMGFPMEDPFAYPSLPGVSFANNTFGILPEEVLQLPVFDANMSLEEQFLHLQNF